MFKPALQTEINWLSLNNMESLVNLKARLKDLYGRDYGAYQSLKGTYQSDTFQLFIDQIPKDPYAPPFTGIYRIRLDTTYCFIPSALHMNNKKIIAYRDYLARCFFYESKKVSVIRGTGNSGLITIAEPGQTILERTSVIYNDNFIELRIFIGLPAEGRIVLGSIAEKMLLDEIPEIIEKSVSNKYINEKACLQHLQSYVDSEHLRSQLKKKKLVHLLEMARYCPEQAEPAISPWNIQKQLNLSHRNR